MAINFIRKFVTDLTGRRKIYFLLENTYSASSLMKGNMISRQIQKLGAYSYVFNLKKEAETSFENIINIKDSVFVILKRALLNNEELFEQLKKNGNKLVWDPADELVKLMDCQELNLIDGVIWANRKCAADMEGYLPKNCHNTIIYHHWDPRCRLNHCREYKLLFLGDTTPENISQEYVEQIKELNVESVSNIGHMDKRDLFVRTQDYSCHFSVRNENTDSFNYKPNSKLSFASAYCANIVLSRDCSNIELLDKSYPYYTDDDLSKVKETVRYSKETFGTKVWNEGLNMLKDVRERTALRRIGRDYIEFLERF